MIVGLAWVWMCLVDDNFWLSVLPGGRGGQGRVLAAFSSPLSVSSTLLFQKPTTNTHLKKVS
jgi:hypothetical protein